MSDSVVQLFVSSITAFGYVGGFLFLLLLVYAVVNRFTATSAKVGQFILRIRYAYIGDNGSPMIQTQYIGPEGRRTTNKEKSKIYDDHTAALDYFDLITPPKSILAGEPSVQVEVLEKTNMFFIGEVWRVVNKKVF